MTISSVKGLTPWRLAKCSSCRSCCTCTHISAVILMLCIIDNVVLIASYHDECL